jgi:hypothetical protein
MQVHHTLLPDGERHVLYKDYRFRILTVASLIFIVVSIISTIFLMPAFLEAYNFKVSETSLAENISNKVNPETKIIKDELIKDNILLNISKAYSKDSYFSDLLGEVIGQRSNISISSISIDPVSSTSTNITIQGISPTRDDLLSFKSRLSKVEGVLSVDLPLSGLTKSEKVPFSMRISKLIK